MLHRASLAVPTLSPPKNGSLRQAALASVQRLQADSASPVNTQSTRKRSYSESDSPNSHSPSKFPPLAQRIRSDLQIGEESPERELLRTQSSPLKSPSPSSPRVKGFPPPAPLAFTPPKIQEGFEILVAQSGENVVEMLKIAKETAIEVTPKVDENVESEEEEIEDSVVCEASVKLEHLCRLRDRLKDLGKRLEDGAISHEEFDVEARKAQAESEVGEDLMNFCREALRERQKQQEEKPKCSNCDGEFSPDHQCYS